MTTNHENQHQHDQHKHDGAETPERPAEFWEELYSGEHPVWSGRVNETLASLASEWTPGRSLDLGCGEGGDVLWLAEHGWEAMGIDLSPTAVSRAQAAAVARGLANARFVVADLAEWAERPAAIDGGADPFDLVTASFFQSPVELQRERILRAAAKRVAPGGHLVLVSHGTPPGGGEGHPDHFVTPESELEVLDLDEADWRILVSEVRTRTGARPDGSEHVFDDTIVVARRSG